MAINKRSYTTEEVLKAYRMAADILEEIVSGQWDLEEGHWTEKQLVKLAKCVDSIDYNNKHIIVSLAGAGFTIENP